MSTQRSAPKRSRSPAVARNTPPERPTSSPSTITESSRASSTWNASLIASIMNSRLIRPHSSDIPSEDAAQFGELGRERRRRIRVRVLEDEADVRVRQRLRLRDPGAHHLERLRLDRRFQVVAEHAEPLQIALVAAETLVPLLLLNPLEIDVRARIVRRAVRRGAVTDRLDERRTAAAARALDRLARRLEHGEHVAAVHADPGNAVAG